MRFAPMMRLGREHDDHNVRGLLAKRDELLAELRAERRKRQEADAEVQRLHDLLAKSHSALLERLQ